MNSIALNSFSSFDTAKNASGNDHPERFYHGFVLGLMVGLQDQFEITSNRESGFGRYDIVLKPYDKEKNWAKKLLILNHMFIVNSDFLVF